MAMSEIRAFPQLSTLSQVMPYSALEGNNSISSSRSAALVKVECVYECISMTVYWSQTVRTYECDSVFEHMAVCVQ